MARLAPDLRVLVAPARKLAKQSHARWDDGLFENYLEEHIVPLWDCLERRSPELRPQSIQIYLELVVSGIAGGYLKAIDGPPTSLLEAFVRDRLPWWFIDSARDRHGKIAASIWNIAEGARQQAAWIEQYLLACFDDFDNPMRPDNIE